MRISPREPARHDNGASDVWALTASYIPKKSHSRVVSFKQRRLIITAMADNGMSWLASLGYCFEI